MRITRKKVIIAEFHDATLGESPEMRERYNYWNYDVIFNKLGFNCEYIGDDTSRGKENKSIFKCQK